VDGVTFAAFAVSVKPTTGLPDTVTDPIKATDSTAEVDADTKDDEP
jgi:hypothetical protein